MYHLIKVRLAFFRESFRPKHNLSVYYLGIVKNTRSQNTANRVNIVWFD